MRRWASEARAGLLIGAVVVCATCAERSHDPTPTPSAAPPTASVATTVSSPPPSVVAPPAAPEKDATIARLLESARISSLARMPGDPSVLEVTLLDERGKSVPARLELAMTRAPISYKAIVAFYRLSRELDLDLVPVSVVRAVRLDELATLLATRRDLLGDLGARAAIRNDGTIAAMARVEPGPGRDVIVATPSPLWVRWATSPVPDPEERKDELRGYVGMLVLDYLSGNVLRRSARIGDGGLTLVENATSFQPTVNPRALDRVLSQLADVVRFPRGLEAALRRFDPARARAVLAPSFEDHLVAPRTLVEVDERRVGLLSLIEARIAEHGAAVVLSL